MAGDPLLVVGLGSMLPYGLPANTIPRMIFPKVLCRNRLLVELGKPPAGSQRANQEGENSITA